MKKLITILTLFIVLISANAYSACSGSSPTWTCTYDTSAADIQTCIDGATAGDTINVTAGTNTWDTQIVIDKALNFIGAGIDSTIIDNDTSGFTGGAGTGDYRDYLIAIRVSADDNNPVIRLSGFTIAVGTRSSGIMYENLDTTDPITDSNNVRIDHIKFTDGGGGWFFHARHMANGVMDNCTIENYKMGGTGSYLLWGSTNAGYEHGSRSSFYIEDCTWTGPTTSSMITNVDGAMRFGIRFCNITTTSYGPEHHGNTTNANIPGGFGMEFYENTISCSDSTSRWIDQRGGKDIMFNNTADCNLGFRVREENADGGQTYPSSEDNGQPQHPSDTYCWGNTDSVGQLDLTAGGTLYYANCDCDVPTEELHFWNENDSFDGSSGIGTGTASQMTAIDPGSGNTNVAFWVTDEGDWNNEESGSSDGVLYRWDGTDTWDEYYEPYDYPHPLRGENATGQGNIDQTIGVGNINRTIGSGNLTVTF